MTFLESLKTRARALQTTLAFPEATDARTAAAIARLLGEGVCSITAVGSPQAVREALVSAGVDADAIDIVDPIDQPTVDRYAALLRERSGGRLSEKKAIQVARDPLMLAGLLVSEGIVDGVVAGAIRATRDIIRAAVRTVGPDEGVNTVSSAFYMLVPSFRGVDDEVLTFADAGVIPEPTPDELADIGAAAARARALVVNDEPRVAFLSFSTKGSADHEAVEMVQTATQIARQLRPDLLIDGELQFDAAYVPSVAERKAPGSPLEGLANVFVFPDLNSGNIGYKITQRIGGAEAFGPILQGLAGAANDLSRGCDADDIVNVAAITAIQART